MIDAPFEDVKVTGHLIDSGIMSAIMDAIVALDGEFETLGKFTNVRSTVVFGGVGANPQIAALRRKPDVVVACVGGGSNAIGMVVLW